MSDSVKTFIIDLPELKAEYDEWLKLPAKFRGNSFKPWQVEPRPEWHGREAIRLGTSSNIFRFPEESSPIYHMLPIPVPPAFVPPKLIVIPKLVVAPSWFKKFKTWIKSVL